MQQEEFVCLGAGAAVIRMCRVGDAVMPHLPVIVVWTIQAVELQASITTCTGWEFGCHSRHQYRMQQL